MPMIDVYAAEGTFNHKHTLAQDHASAVMHWEQATNLALFRNNIAAFIHKLPASAIAAARASGPGGIEPACARR
jgi:hypothetical protein